MNAVHVAEFGKRRFVSGLFWQALSDPRHVMAEVRRVGKSMDFDLYVLTRQSVPQVGFGAHEDGAERGLLSLAMAIEEGVRRSGVAGNWLGAFSLGNETYAYVAVRDDAILPESDFAGPQEAVRNRMEQDFGIGGWDVVFAPQSWGFSASQERAAIEFLSDDGGKIRWQKGWALEPLDRKLPLVPMLGALAAIALGAGGFAYWKSSADAQERLAALEATKRVREAMQHAQALPSARQGPRPWAAAPLPAEFIAGCVRGMGGLLYESGGWSLSGVSCADTGISFVWERSRSTIPMLHRAVPDARVDVSGDKAMLTRPLSGIRPGGEEPLLGDQEAISAFASAFQASGIDLRLTANPAPVRLPGSEVKPPPQDWKVMKFLITSKLDPLSLAPYFKVPGARVKRISGKGASSIDWTVEGELYAR